MPLPSLPTMRTFTTSFLVITTATIFINDNILEAGTINGSSMAPTLSPIQHLTGQRDAVLWRKFGPTLNLSRGDVVLFMNPRDPEACAVKRVVALEGDTVVLDPRRRPSVERNPREELAWRRWYGKVEVPPGHVWVEGDNWRASSDSNYYGPVAKSMITGIAWRVMWPFNRIGSTPWEGFESSTKVLVGKGRNGKEWHVDGLPVELEELREEKVLPPMENLDGKTGKESKKEDKCKGGRWSW